MKANEYVDAAIRTAPTLVRNDQSFILGGIGVAGEAIEAFEAMNSHIIDAPKLIKELGDVTWYVALICYVHYIAFEDLTLSDDMLMEFGMRNSLATPISLVQWNGKELLFAAKGVSEYAKKAVFHQHPVNTRELEHLLGRVVKRVQRIALALDTTIEDVLAKNIDKLKIRYPERFTSAASMNKNEAVEG